MADARQAYFPQRIFISLASAPPLAGWRPCCRSSAHACHRTHLLEAKFNGMLQAAIDTKSIDQIMSVE